MFIGRKKEMQILEKAYSKKKFEFIVMRGRRRVGKSTILREFCKDKKDVIYFTAQQRNKIDAINNFSKVINEHFDRLGKYNDFEEAFEELFKYSIKQRIVIVIDEFPYLVTSDNSVMSILQSLIDKYIDESKMMLIICGSSISFMEDKVLAYKAPLYGRITGQLKIEKLPFYDVCDFLKGFKPEDKIKLYSTFGGIPAYLRFVNNEESVEENIIDTFMDSSSFIFTETETLLKEEFREPSSYNSIINSIANGASKSNEIATKVGMATDMLTSYLNKLIEINLIRKERPITEDEKSKRTIYRMNDNLFMFWYRFISNNLTSIEFNDNKKDVYNSVITPYFEDYIGRIFEDICKEFLLLNISSDILPFTFTKIGRWWGTNNKLKREEEIDILAYSNNKEALFVECKYRNEKVDIKILDALIEKSSLLNQFNFKYYAIFSKSGFTKEVTNYAKQNKNIYLFTLKDIVK